jgi:uncharacterized protein
MQLDLSEIVTRSGMRSRVEVDQERIDDEELRFAEPLVGQLTFENSGDLLSILGRVRTVLEIPCARCLADVRVPLELAIEERLPLDEVIHPNTPPAEGAEFDTLVSTIIHLEQGRPILDTDELIRQQILPEIPIQTLCGGACRGLCPHCGHDLNQGPCACPPDNAEGALASLGALLKERNGATGG